MESVTQNRPLEIGQKKSCGQAKIIIPAYVKTVYSKSYRTETSNMQHSEMRILKTI